MTTNVQVTHDPEGSLIKKPEYLIELENKWKRWTGIDDKEVSEALKDLSGDLWSELRKLEALTCKEIENRKLPDDFKEFLKARIREAWRDIIDHQKVGLDKLCIVVRKYLPGNEEIKVKK
jgi:hypothetical protein